MSKPFHVVLHSGNSTNTPDGEFACSFEELSEAFEKLPRMFLEPDGSFVWVIETNGSRFQLDGLLTDNGTRLLNCEIKGTCNAEIWDLLLDTIGTPSQQIVVQLIEQGKYLSDAEFRSAFEIE